ncbi:ABC transporter substrate-binding protein [Scytonema sp. NUACC26]|uniref:ABC transporter substrate-binding protein n=1 Tax=Scytonema sp. NUACC26 TaxID=3140176 RepID=UPI0034DC6260
MRRILQLALIGGLLVFLMLLACSKEIHYSVTSSVRSFSKATANTTVRVVQHSAGKTLVPVHPERVVILHGFVWEDAIAVGVKPIGAPLKKWVSLLQLAPSQSQGVVDVDYLPTNIEKVLALKPDLILGWFELQKDIYPLLSHIAPTVLIGIKSARDWKDHFMQVAEALNKTEIAQKVLANYHSRLQKFKATGSDRLSKTPISVIGPYSENCRVFSWEKNSFSKGILESAGITVKSAPSPLMLGKLGLSTISWERLDIIDANIIFVTRSYFGTMEEHQTAFKGLQAIPFWSRLKSVQQGKVHEVGVYWVGNGPKAANRVLDDLFKYLLNS